MTATTALARREEPEFEVMDKLDEEQIQKQLNGQLLLEDYFYEFQQSGKTVTGISWNGIKAFTFSMAKAGLPISTEQIDIEDHMDFVIAKAKVKSWQGEFHVGVAHQSKLMEVSTRDEKGNRTGEKELVPDPFYIEKASSKAKRNAYREIIPEFAIIAEYRRWKSQKLAGQWPEPPSAESIKNMKSAGASTAVEKKEEAAPKQNSNGDKPVVIFFKTSEAKFVPIPTSTDAYGRFISELAEKYPELRFEGRVDSANSTSMASISFKSLPEVMKKQVEALMTKCADEVEEGGFKP